MKLKYYIFTLTVITFFLFIGNYKIANASSEDNIEYGTYIIKSAIDENYVLNIAGASTVSYANLEIQENKNKDNQKFNVNPVGDGTYTISAVHSNKFIDIHVSSQIAQNNLIQYGYQGYIYQKWVIKPAGDGYYYIVSKYNNMYMSVDERNAENGINVSLKQYSGDLSQKFKLEIYKDSIEKINDGIYSIASAKNENYVLNIAGASTVGYANLEIQENNNKDNQKFYIKTVEDNTYTMSALHSNKFIDIHVSSKITPNNLIQYSEQNYIYQKWTIRSAGDGFYYIVSKYNNLYMTIDEENVKNGVNVSLKPYSGALSQKFKLKEFDYVEEKVKEGAYTIASAKDEKYVLDIASGSISSYANLNIEENKNKDNQKFYLKSVGDNVYTISALHSNKYLDIQVSSKINPNNVIQYGYQDYVYQKWTVRATGDGYYYIISNYNGLYMDIDGENARNGANILLKPYSGELSQKFKLVTSVEFDEGEDDIEINMENGVYSVASAKDENYVLDIANSSKDSYANLQISKENNKRNQIFNFKVVEDSTYTINAVHSGKYLDIQLSSNTNPNNVIQFSRNNYVYQKWAIKSAGDGYYYIISKYNGLYMDIVNGNIEDGANVSLKPFSGELSQKFKIVPVEDYEKFEEVEDDDAVKVKSGSYTIVSGNNNNFVLDISGASNNDYGNLNIYEKKNTNNQKFCVKYGEDGTYTICAGHSNKYLDIQLSTGNNIIQYKYQGYIYQKWKIKYAGDGYYYIISNYNGLYMDIEGEKAKNSANVFLKPYSGESSQKFKFVETSINDTGRSAQFKRDHPEMKIGIDVSCYQETIDWAAVKRDGIDYVMIRVGYRGYGEAGNIVKDSKFDEYITGAKAAGLDVGVYFFSQAKNYQEGVTEANYTLDLIRKYNINYPVAFDTEQSSSPTNTGRADNISNQARTEAAKGFCSTVKNAGYNTLIYASPSWLNNKLYLNQLSGYDIWLANYTGATQENPLEKPSSYQGKYVMWQYTSTGTVNGISGNVDCNLLY